MKKTLYILILIMSLSLTSCMTTGMRQINKVEMGMTKDDIRKVLGKPTFKNACETGEQWGYRKWVGEFTMPEKAIFLVTFNNNGQVTQYETLLEPQFGPQGY